MTKLKYAILMILLNSLIYGQQNLINNGSFEFGTGTPSCVNTGSSQVNQFRYQEFDDMIYFWNIAESCDDFTIGFGDNCKFPQPRWMDKTICPPSIFNNQIVGNRFVYLRDDDDGEGTDFTDAIRTGLRENLVRGATYNLRIRMAQAPNYSDVNTWEANILRFHFSKFGENWYREVGNNRWDDAAILSLPKDPYAGWQSLQCTFTVPDTDDYNDLGNMILEMQDGFLFIDNVELYKVCPQQIYNENLTYEYFNHPYSAVDKIEAGNSVNPNTSDGNVIIEPFADVTYIAGNKIILKPGFHAKLGSKFVAKIDVCSIASPCFNYVGRAASPTTDSVPDEALVDSNDILFQNTNNSLESITSQVKVNSSTIVPSEGLKIKIPINLPVKLTIYPNPNNGWFVLELNNVAKGNYKLQISDALGRSVMQQNYVVNEQNLKQNINLQAQGKGIYFVKINSEQINEVRKVVVE